MPVDPLRITFLLPGSSPHPTGGFLVVYEHANRLAERGHHVVVLHGWPPRSVAEPLGWWPPRSSEDRVSWFALDSRVSVGFEHVLDPPALPEADWLINAGLNPLRRSGYPPSKGLRAAFVQGFGMLPKDEEAAELRAPGLKICVSGWARQQVCAIGAADSEVVHVPNGVDTNVFRVRTPIATRPRRVAMLFGNVPVKGNDIGIAALELLRARMPDTEAIVFGVLPRPPELPTWIEYRHLPTREELATEVYGRSAVLMCPSRSEGFYLCGLEAMASGCAFVSTDVGGVRDFAEPGVTALVSPLEDVGGLADNLVCALSDTPLRIALAEAGTMQAQRFDWTFATERLETHLTEFLRGRAQSEESPPTGFR